MKPRLYQASETAFASLGIGILEECTECFVYEERNGVFECNFKYPVNGRLIKEIIPDRWIMCDASYGDESTIGTGIRTKKLKDQRFKITTISKPMKGYISVYCEHCSYLSARLMIQPSVTITNASRSGALTAWKNALVGESNKFTIATDTDGTTHSSVTWNIKDFENARQALGGVRGSILDVWGGEYKFDNYTVGLYTHRGDNNGVTIRYGKNLTDINQEENIASTYTSIYPFATYTDDEQEEHVVTLDSPYYVDSDYAVNYETRRILRVDFSNKYEQGTIPDKTSLRQYAVNYISDNKVGIPDVNIKLSYIDLSKTVNYQDYKFLEKVSLCDTVHVYFEQLNIDTTAEVIAIEWDVINDRVDTVEIGNAKSSLSDVIKKQQSEISETKTEIKEHDQSFKQIMDAAIDSATDAITGATGGNVVLRPKDHPEELLIMNTDDVATAQYVWRWTLGGLGFSENGVDGPFTTAITSEGEIVADFITTGHMSANRIYAGTIQSVNGSSFWNLSTGEFSISGGTKIDNDPDKTIDDVIQSIEDIEVGGTNLIPHSINLADFKSDDSDGTHLAVTRYDDYVALERLSGNPTLYYGIHIEGYSVHVGETYTLSIEASGVYGTTVELRVSYVYIAAGMKIINLQNGRNILHFTAEYDAPLMIYIQIKNPGESCAVAKIKLERGNKATDWSPDPDDIFDELKSTNELVNLNYQETKSYIDSNYESFLAFKNEYENFSGKINDYMRFDPSEGLTIGSNSRDTKINIIDNKISFINGNNVNAYIGDKLMSIHNVEINDSMKLGGFFFSTRPDGGVSISWKGV